MTKGEEYIAFILGQLRKGNTDVGKLCGLFCTKFNKSRTTFYNHYPEADKKRTEELQAIETKKAAIVSDAAIKAVKRDIMDLEERMEIVTKIARGVSRRIGDDIITPTDRDRLAAIDLLNKIDKIYDDNNKGLGVTVTINADGITLKSDEI